MIKETLRDHAVLIKWVSLGVTVGSLMLLASSLPLRSLVRQAGAVLDQQGPLGPLLYGLLYVGAALLLVPGSIPTLGAGAIFGMRTGLLIAWLASEAGAVLAFLISRYIARDRIAALASKHPTFRAFERAVGEGGWKVVAMLRLSTFIPFNLQNYFFGLTPIRFSTCVLTTGWAMLPGTFLFVYLGHVAGLNLGGDRPQGFWNWGMLIVGLVATVGVTTYVAHQARKRIARHLRAEDDSAAPAAGNESSEVPRPGFGTAVTSVSIALLVTAAAVCSQLRPEWIELILAHLLGSP